MKIRASIHSKIKVENKRNIKAVELKSVGVEGENSQQRFPGLVHSFLKRKCENYKIFDVVTTDVKN